MVALRSDSLARLAVLPAVLVGGGAGVERAVVQCHFASPPTPPYLPPRKHTPNRATPRLEKRLRQVATHSELQTLLPLL